MAERNSLLNCRTGNGTEGSNPSLSAKSNAAPKGGIFCLWRTELALVKQQTKNDREQSDQHLT